MKLKAKALYHSDSGLTRAFLEIPCRLFGRGFCYTLYTVRGEQLLAALDSSLWCYQQKRGMLNEIRRYNKNHYKEIYSTKQAGNYFFAFGKGYVLFLVQFV